MRWQPTKSVYVSLTSAVNKKSNILAGPMFSQTAQVWYSTWTRSVLFRLVSVVAAERSVGVWMDDM